MNALAIDSRPRSEKRAHLELVGRIERLEEDADTAESELAAVKSLLRSILTTTVATLTSLVVACILLALNLAVNR